MPALYLLGTSFRLQPGLCLSSAHPAVPGSGVGCRQLTPTKMNAGRTGRLLQCRERVRRAGSRHRDLWVLRARAPTLLQEGSGGGGGRVGSQAPIPGSPFGSKLLWCCGVLFFWSGSRASRSLLSSPRSRRRPNPEMSRTPAKSQPPSLLPVWAALIKMNPFNEKNEQRRRWRIRCVRQRGRFVPRLKGAHWGCPEGCSLAQQSRGGGQGGIVKQVSTYPSTLTRIESSSENTPQHHYSPECFPSF